MLIEADALNEAWTKIQNDYFQEKGWNLRVDEKGIVGQMHLGPVRLRRHSRTFAIKRTSFAIKTPANPWILKQSLSHHAKESGFWKGGW